MPYDERGYMLHPKKLRRASTLAVALAAAIASLAAISSAPAYANNVSGSCSEAGFGLDTTVYYETAGAKNLLWRVTKLTWKISGDASRHSNNASLTFFDNTGWKDNYENGSTTSDNQWNHVDTNWLMNKTGAKYEIEGIFDVPYTEDPRCFGGFFYL